MYYSDSDKWMLRIGVVFAILVLVLGIIFIPKGVRYIKYQNAIRDIELWNGKVTEKKEQERTKTYACGTYTTGSGDNKTTHTRYCNKQVKDYWLETTAGEIDIERSVDKPWFQDFPIPEAWSSAYVGMPVSVEHTYQNYDKAAKTPLFRKDTREVKKKYKDHIPEWPRVYDVYKVNRLLQPSSVWFTGEDLDRINNKISDINGDLGPTKQVNAIYFLIPERIVEDSDSDDYYYAVTEAWEGVNKNEYVTFITIGDQGKIKLVQGVSWSINVKDIELELDNYAVNELKEIKTVDDVMKLLDKSKEILEKKFIRQEMKDLKFLDDDNRKNRKL